MASTPSAGITPDRTKIGYADTAEAAPTNIAELLSVTPPKPTYKHIDLTNLDSDADEGMAGRKGASVCSGTFTYTPGNRAVIDGLNGVMKYWTITKSNGDTRIFYGYGVFGDDQISKDQATGPTCSFEIYVSGVIA